MDETQARLTLRTTVGGRPAPMVGLRGTLADAFVGFSSLMTDFEYVSRGIDAMQEEAANRAPDATDDREAIARQQAMVFSLWTGVVVRYARCFEAGYRSGYVRHLSVPDDLCDDHRWFQNHRGTHLAHANRDNPWEPRLDPVAVLEPPPGEPAVLDVVVVQPVVEAVPERGDALKRLAVEFADQCNAMMAAIRAEIRRQAEERGVGTLYEAASRQSLVRFDGDYLPRGQGRAE